MVYNIAEIKYTSCYPVICNLVPKKANVMYTGQGNKEQVSQDLKDRFLIYILFIAVDKISFSTKFRRRKNICIDKISVKKKYRHRKNIGFNKISLPAKYRRRKNIVIAKISVSTKYGRRQNISEEKISALQK